MVLVIFWLVILSTITEAIVVDCEFISGYNEYSCYALGSVLVQSKYDRKVTRARGYHLEEGTDDLVTSFYAHSNRVSFFPKRLKTIFKNINYIRISSAQLEEIKKEDLQEFGKNLLYLSLRENQIEYLESDLFIYNKNLEKISFAGNKIKHVAYDTFGGLNFLYYLDLSSNSCTGENDVTYDRSKLLALIRKTEESCPVPSLIRRLIAASKNWTSRIFPFNIGMIYNAFGFWCKTIAGIYKIYRVCSALYALYK